MDTNESLVERIFLFLEEGDWKKANAYCERLLDKDPRNQYAYLGKLMAVYHVKKESELSNLKKNFDRNINYQRILRFGDPDFVQKIKQYSETVKENIRNKKLEALKHKQNRQFERRNKPLGMKWYKFLIWFSLPISAFLYLLVSILAFAYGCSTTILLSEPRIYYISYGIFYLGLCFYTTITWIRLVKFKKDALSFLYILYSLYIIMPLIFQIANNQFIVSASLSVIPYSGYFILNLVYFENRRSMFSDNTMKKTPDTTPEQSDKAVDEQTDSEDPYHFDI